MWQDRQIEKLIDAVRFWFCQRRRVRTTIYAFLDYSFPILYFRNHRAGTTTSSPADKDPFGICCLAYRLPGITWNSCYPLLSKHPPGTSTSCCYEARVDQMHLQRCRIRFWTEATLADECVEWLAAEFLTYTKFERSGGLPPVVSLLLTGCSAGTVSLVLFLGPASSRSKRARYIKFISPNGPFCGTERSQSRFCGAGVSTIIRPTRVCPLWCWGFPSHLTKRA